MSWFSLIYFDDLCCAFVFRVLFCAFACLLLLFVLDVLSLLMCLICLLPRLVYVFVSGCVLICFCLFLNILVYVPVLFVNELGGC